MKIILANKFYYLKCGATRYLFDLEKMLHDHGHETVPFSMQNSSNVPTPFSKFFVSKVETEKVQLNWQGLRTLGRMLFSFEAQEKLSQLIRRTQPDVLHAHTIYYQISPSIFLTARELGLPTILTVQDYHMISPQYMRWSHHRVEDWSRAGVLRAALSKFHKNSFFASLAVMITFRLHQKMGLYHLVDRYTTASRFVKDEMIKKGFPAEKIQVIPFSVDAKNITPAIGWDSGYVLFVGRFVEEKGVWTLLQAAKNLPHIKFKFVGFGPEEEKLKRAAISIPNVEFVGFAGGEALWQLYRGARCVVVPSLWQEVFGIVVIEAMAAGKPVIASNIGGLPETIVDRVTGLLVQPGSVPELVDAIERLSKNETLVREMGWAGRERVLKEYNHEKHFSELMKVYETAIFEHRGK